MWDRKTALAAHSLAQTAISDKRERMQCFLCARLFLAATCTDRVFISAPFVVTILAFIGGQWSKDLHWHTEENKLMLQILNLIMKRMWNWYDFPEPVHHRFTWIHFFLHRAGCCTRPVRTWKHLISQCKCICVHVCPRINSLWTTLANPETHLCHPLHCLGKLRNEGVVCGLAI